MANGTRNKKGDIFVMKDSRLVYPIKCTPLGKAFLKWLKFSEEIQNRQNDLKTSDAKINF